MSNATNKYYAIAYKLYTIEDGERNMEEEAPAADPFIFISGFGTTIPGFESHISGLSKGEEFDFTLSKTEAYGEYLDEAVIDLDKNIFSINGKFDDEHIKVDAVIPLQNEEGRRFQGLVTAISDDKVTVDLNHPLAGMDLNFVGKVIECHDVTNEEIQQIFNAQRGGCGGGCGHCGGDCGEGGCHDGHDCEGGCGGEHECHGGCK